MKYLSIDPSINSLGWAHYDSSCKTWRHGTILPKGNTLPARLEFIGYALAAVDNQPGVLICEFPQFFGASVKGSVAAVDGSCFGLAAVVGYIQAKYEMKADRVFHYLPSQWKGQVPKAGMMHRFLHAFNYEAKSDHEAEAALLLKYHLDTYGSSINKLDK